MAVKSFQRECFDGEFGEDENLVWDLFKNGDKEAFAYLYNTYSSLLFRYGCKLIPDKELVKDCMHDIFTEIWRNKANLSNPASVKNYLVKSLRNKIIRVINKQSKFVNDETVNENDLGFIDSKEYQLINLETTQENEKKLKRSINTLSNKQKEVIFLLYYNNLSPAEVASIMSVSIRTIYNTKFNALESLKSQMVPIFLYLFLSDFF